MRLYYNGDPFVAGSEDRQEIEFRDGLAWFRTSEGWKNALAVRQGDAIWVSFEGNQYRFDTKRPREGANVAVASGEFRAPMPGQIVDVMVTEGSAVKKGDKVLVLEAMKMQQPFLAPFDGTVKLLRAQKGHQVNEGDVLVQIEPEASA